LSTPVLQLELLCKHYGGLRVTNDVTLDIAARELHAIIGPNGAGKTTLINQISGLTASDSGRIFLNGRDVTRRPMHERAALGIARSFQITSVLSSFSALENVALAIQAKNGSSFRFWGRASNEETINDEATSTLEKVGLGTRVHVPASQLSYGEKRVLELAMTLAMNPAVLILDEPLAGTSREDGERLIALLSNLKGQFPIILIEHDTNAVFALADRVSVMTYGRIILTGTSDEVRVHPEVIAAYLGSDQGQINA
jgi:branched-chain amino acid transport system ATP-binding protein